MRHDRDRRFEVIGRNEAFSADNPLRRAARLIPNLITLAAVICGLTSIRLSGEGEFAWAMTAILAAAMLDAADGHVARLLSAESAIGAELDFSPIF